MVRASGGGPGFLIFVPPRGLTWVPAPSSPHAFVNVLLLQTWSRSKEPVLGPLARYSFGHMLLLHSNLTFLGSVISARMESFLGQYWLWQELFTSCLTEQFCPFCSMGLLPSIHGVWCLPSYAISPNRHQLIDQRLIWYGLYYWKHCHLWVCLTVIISDGGR